MIHVSKMTSVYQLDFFFEELGYFA